MIIELSPGRFYRLSMYLAVWLVFALMGCGDASKATVSGTVTYKGKPLTAGTVAFVGKDNQIASGAIESNGRYSVVHVPVGPVKISISTPPAPPKNKGGADAMKSVTPVSIPGKYSDPEKSGLTYNVQTGSQKYPIKLD